VRVHAPLLTLGKASIIRLGAKLGVDFALTRSCYDPPPVGEGDACGHCDACILRRKGFADAGISDPTAYAERAR
jgi:7-cyano-7-deazaguanine synthase